MHNSKYRGFFKKKPAVDEVTTEPPMPEACQKRCCRVRRGDQMAEGEQYPSQYCYHLTETNLEVTFESFSTVEGYRDNLNGMSLPVGKYPNSESSAAVKAATYAVSIMTAVFAMAAVQ